MTKMLINNYSLYKKMKETKDNKSVRYRVFDKNGKYHHSYMEYSDALNCAKYIGGRVADIEKDNFNPSDIFADK